MSNTLFSSGLFNNNKGIGLYRSLSDLGSIRSGAYKKLIKKAYSEDPGIFKEYRSTSTAKDKTSTIAKTQSAADDLFSASL